MTEKKIHAKFRCQNCDRNLDTEIIDPEYVKELEEADNEHKKLCELVYQFVFHGEEQELIDYVKEKVTP